MNAATVKISSSVSSSTFILRRKLLAEFGRQRPEKSILLALELSGPQDFPVRAVSTSATVQPPFRRLRGSGGAEGLVARIPVLTVAPLVQSRERSAKVGG